MALVGPDVGMRPPAGNGYARRQNAPRDRVVPVGPASCAPATHRPPPLRLTRRLRGLVGSVIKKRRKRMAKKKHRKLLRKTRHQRRNKK
jgi:hypothetical protein